MHQKQDIALSRPILPARPVQPTITLNNAPPIAGTFGRSIAAGAIRCRCFFCNRMVPIGAHDRIFPVHPVRTGRRRCAGSGQPLPGTATARKGGAR